MNTIKIRNEHPELIERIRKTIRDYKDWDELLKTMANKGIEQELDMYGNFCNLTRFFNESLIDDIEELAKVIDKDEDR